MNRKEHEKTKTSYLTSLRNQSSSIQNCNKQTTHQERMTFDRVYYPPKCRLSIPGYILFCLLQLCRSVRRWIPPLLSTLNTSANSPAAQIKLTASSWFSPQQLNQQLRQTAVSVHCSSRKISWDPLFKRCICGILCDPCRKPMVRSLSSIHDLACSKLMTSPSLD